MESDDSETNAIIFVLEQDETERNRLQGSIAGAGFVVMAPPSLSGAVSLLKNNAACDLVILGVDAMQDDAEWFDRLVSARTPAPAIIVYGMDPAAKKVLHCLTAGATDFLAKPASDDDLVNAVYNAVKPDDDARRPEPSEAIRAASHVAGWIELTATSELEQFRRLQRFSDSLFASQFPQDVCDDLKMAVEEVGRNAVEWGNRFNPDKRVHVSYCLFSDRIVIKVEDEGEGFIPENVPDPTADPVKTMQDRQNAGKRPGGYGVYLLHKLVDDIVYNEKGNAVLLIKYLPKKLPVQS